MSFISEILIQAFVYLVVAIITFLIFDFISKGYLRTYTIVKASRGKKVLVRVLSLTGYYYKAGKLDSRLLQFKNREKNIDSYLVRKTDIINEMGVGVICVDETTKKVIHVQNDPREGHDTEKTDGLIKRALYKPSLKDNPKEMIQLIMTGATLLVSLITLYLLYNLGNVVPVAGGVI